MDYSISEIFRQLGLSRSTVYGTVSKRSLHRMSFGSRRPTRVPWLNARHRAACLAWTSQNATPRRVRYYSEIYLADNMLYKGQTVQMTASCDVWMMTKSVVSVAAIVGCNRCHTPWHRIEEAFDVSLEYMFMRFPHIAKVDLV
ncbi:uncharacterized protein TNCV_3049951 [Trichonephila clavipes]|nr:uncharacterized protein TNCV_3049951 [Trichonephila clavipes]